MQALPRTNDVPASSSSRDLVSGLRSQLWTILLITTVVTTVALVLSLLQTPRYTTAASVVLQDSGDTGATTNMATEKQIASSNTVASQVIQALHLQESPDQVSSGLSISVPVDANVLVFSYTSSDPKQAQQRAQAFADAYLSYRHEALLRASQSANDLVDVRIAELEKELAIVTDKMGAAKNHAKREAYRVKANALFAQIGVQEQHAAGNVGNLAGTGDRLVMASLPTVPSQPRVIVNGLLGAFFGLSLGTGVGLWKASFNRRLQTENDVNQVLNIPLLAVIPRPRRVGAPSSAAMIGERSATTDAYRELVAKVLSTPVGSTNGSHPPGRSLERVQAGVRKIAVVALDGQSDPGEIAANVGAVMALSGRSVLVVSTATDENGWEEFLGPHSGPGMTDVMRGHADLADAIRPTGIDGLRALPRGSEDQSWMLLDAERVHRTVGDMASLANIILVHVAARPGTGATAIVAACDAVLYTGILRSTSVDEARRIRGEIEILGKPTLGAVMFERPSLPDARRDAAKPKHARRRLMHGLRGDRSPRVPPALGDPPRHKAIRHVLRSRLSEHPKLYLPLARIRYPGPSPEVIGRATELVIDGYTRSACTFAVYAFQLAQQLPRASSKRSTSRNRAGSPANSRGVRLAHHLHAPAQLLEAARRGVPALVVIREPEGAILSQVLQEPHVSLRDALVSYERFYSALTPHADSFVAGEFQEVTQDFGSVIRRLNKRFGTHYRMFVLNDDNVRQCFDLIKERTTTDPAWRRQVLSFESGTVSLHDLLAAWPASRTDEHRKTEVWIPSDERTKAKEALRERWNAPELGPLRDRAFAAYNAFLRATGDDATT